MKLRSALDATRDAVAVSNIPAGSLVDLEDTVIDALDLYDAVITDHRAFHAEVQPRFCQYLACRIAAEG